MTRTVTSFALAAFLSLSSHSFANSCNTNICGDDTGVTASACKSDLVKTCNGLNSADTIEIEIDTDVDTVGGRDLIYLSSGDSPRTIIPPHLYADHNVNFGSAKRVDISHMFGSGPNDLRIEAMAQSSQFGFSARIFKNGQLISVVDCSHDACSNKGSAVHSKSGHVYYDDTVTVSTNNPSSQPVGVDFVGLDPSWETKIYINDMYTGESIQNDPNFSLPPGEYVVGVGIHKFEDVSRGTSNGSARNIREYSGEYYEKVIQVADAPLTVDFSSADLLPLQSTVRIGVVPVHQFNPSGSSHTLSGAVVDRLKQQLAMVNEMYVEPFSYGLQSWDVSFLPEFDDYPIVSSGQELSASDFFKNDLSGRYSEHYDVLIVLYPQPNHGGAAASGGFIHLPSSLVTNNPTISDDSGSYADSELPIEIVLHEVMHVYEQWHKQKLFQWKGVDGIHGSRVYGWDQRDHSQYSEDGILWEHPSWIRFYKNALRGTLVETNSMEALGKNDPSVIFDPLVSGDRYAGLFNTVRRGLGNVRDTVDVRDALIGKEVTINNRFYENSILSSNGGDLLDTFANLSPANRWFLERDGDFFRIANASDPDTYLRRDHQNITTPLVTPYGSSGWDSPKWYLQIVDPYNDVFILENDWYDGDYLVANGADSLSVSSDAHFQTPLKSAWQVSDTCARSSNAVPNCSFEVTTATNWQIVTNSGGSAWPSWGDTDSSDRKGGSEVKVNINSSGSAPWHVQLRTQLALDNAGSYVLRFKAKTEDARKIEVNLGEQGGNWESYFNTGPVTLASQWQEYSFLLEDIPVDAAAVLDFNVGEYSTDAVYIDEVSVTPAAVGYSFIESAWPNANGVRLHTENGDLEAGNASNGWHSAHWTFTPIDGDYVRITNRHKPYMSLHIENGSLEAGSAPEHWHSAHWELEPVENTSLQNAYRLKNRWQSDQYLNIENMELQSSAVPEGYWSSYWFLEDLD